MNRRFWKWACTSMLAAGILCMVAPSAWVPIVLWAWVVGIGTLAGSFVPALWMLDSPIMLIDERGHQHIGPPLRWQRKDRLMRIVQRM